MKRVLPLLMAAVMLLPVVVLADLHDPNNAADYLIVTTQELIDGYPWINQLADWRNEHGRTAMVVATDSIWAEFGTGVPSDTVLKTFLHYARDNWQAPQLKDVFIVGHHVILPSHLEQDTVTGDFLSDYFYSTDPDCTNYLPVLNIGRLPWSPEMSPSLWEYSQKIIAYENAQDDLWQSRLHLIADSSDAAFTFWQDFAEPLLQEVPPEYAVERDYVDFGPEHEWHGDRASIIANFNAGSYLSAYVGHASGDVWKLGRMDSLLAADFAPLTNNERMPITVVMRADFTDDGIGTIPVELLANANGGAIAVIGWPIGWAISGTNYKRIFFSVATSDSVGTLGDVGRFTASEFSSIYPITPTWSSAKVTLLGTLLLGDPGLVLPPRPTVAEEITAIVPESVRLLGNYPNPFNASTVIKFELDRAASVSLKVYDVLGREAATLVNESRHAGSYSVTWDASRAASGVYFAVLQAGDVRQTMKMMMLK